MSTTERMRVGAIDVGSNSVRLLVADILGSHDRSDALTVARAGEPCRLARGLDRTGNVEPEMAERAASLAADFARRARALGAVHTLVGATAALRNAANGKWVASRITERSGLPVRILTGDEEARLVYQSVVAGLGGRAEQHSCVVFDIGGGSDLFKDFPTLRFLIPHGGGAVPYHWGRFRGLAQEMKKPLLQEHLLKNIFFDTCVYHQPGIDLLTKVIPVDNILFASEMIGAVRGIDPETGHYFDDTKRYIQGAVGLDETTREKIFEGNARRVFPRLDAQLTARANCRSTWRIA